MILPSAFGSQCIFRGVLISEGVVMGGRVTTTFVALMIGVLLVSIVPAQGQNTQWVTLADVLSQTRAHAGPPPRKYTIPFLVLSVVTDADGNCSLELVTNGTLFDVSADADWGNGCSHLPALHELVWGFVRHSAAGTFLRQSGLMSGVASNYVDLVWGGTTKHPDVAHYVVDTAQDIDANWGRVPRPTATTASAPISAKTLNQLALNSAEGASSQAESAAKSEGYHATADQMATLIKEGKASECVVMTAPHGASVYIDGKPGGTSPLAFDLFRHPDANRIITVSLKGYKTVVRSVDPNGKEIVLNLTLKPVESGK